jgi:hypothetical protein
MPRLVFLGRSGLTVVPSSRFLVVPDKPGHFLIAIRGGMCYLLRVETAGRSAAWVAHLPWEQGVGGSNPLAPTSH